MRKDRRQKWQGTWVCSHADHRQHVMIHLLSRRGSATWIVPFDAVMFTEGREEVDLRARHVSATAVPPTSAQTVRAGCVLGGCDDTAVASAR